jgi:hypothetical protein
MQHDSGMDLVASIGASVLDCPAADRETRIAELCNDAKLAQDAELAQKVRRWVTGHEPTGQALSPEELLGPDNRIAGRFRIQSFLGRGGMGEVYAVEDTELGGRIALKMIHPNLLGDPETAARFRREIQLARQVTHPNVCRVFDVGKNMVNGQERLFPFDRMVSRAYHDSLFMSRLAPTAMVFIPCRGGVSHRPDEYASPDAIAQGTLVLAETLAHLAA